MKAAGESSIDTLSPSSPALVLDFPILSDDEQPKDTEALHLCFRDSGEDSKQERKQTLPAFNLRLKRSRNLTHLLMDEESTCYIKESAFEEVKGGPETMYSTVLSTPKRQRVSSYLACPPVKAISKADIQYLLFDNEEKLLLPLLMM
eukprot:CAMPEP_0194241114 /NCGR_PEP_ID=MMETSP0158-20130606/7076_1 /TAXON_ID=33649 /ORGANISM="Thalassionema nitzschioides, Strain L26-B" /LENGTH=146 /DNA_ID=CAMNT_0038975945 /DNA_START=168 /DNA_END=608 /DNA_ORIENTATION=-